MMASGTVLEIHVHNRTHRGIIMVFHCLHINLVSKCCVVPVAIFIIFLLKKFYVYSQYGPFED